MATSITELDTDDVDFHVCDEPDCLNSYTPYKTEHGRRLCVTHGHDNA